VRACVRTDGGGRARTSSMPKRCSRKSASCSTFSYVSMPHVAPKWRSPMARHTKKPPLCKPSRPESVSGERSRSMSHDVLLVPGANVISFELQALDRVVLGQALDQHRNALRSITHTRVSTGTSTSTGEPARPYRRSSDGCFEGSGARC